MIDSYGFDIVMPIGSDYNRLMCPICKGANLHQQAVGVYHHTSNDNRGILVAPNGECTVHTNIHANVLNPSRGREGMRISFWCEIECKVPDLLLYQHKGTTYVEWDNTLSGSKLWFSG